MDPRFQVEVTPSYSNGAWRTKITVLDAHNDEVLALMHSERVAREMAEHLNAHFAQQEVVNG
jgi:hypothetical protein